jgi:large subunit ribosomal protein L5
MAKEKESGKKKDAGQPAGKPGGKPAKQAKATKAGKPEGAGAEPAAPKGPKAPVEPARLRVKYRAEVVPALMKQFGYTNVMQVPKLVKVVLNRGTGDAASEAKVMETYVDELRAITGQRPVVTRARRSIAAFKLREGMPIGCKVTLRGERMYEFFDRLVSLTLPRTGKLQPRAR